MRNVSNHIFMCVLGMLISSCAGIKYLTIQTQEPAKITLPESVRSVLVVDNVAKQPDNIGHDIKKLGKKTEDRTSVPADSMSVYYTEALAQFLGEEDFFDKVLYSHIPLRTDNDFWQEKPLMPDDMNRLKKENGVDAIVSLDKLILITNKQEHFRQEGVTYAGIKGRIQSVVRVYMPTYEGQIPALQYTDSLSWEGYDLTNSAMEAEFILPSEREAMKEMAVRAAEKMTTALSPHWQEQNRWLYMLQNKLVQDGIRYAEDAQWENAAGKWMRFFDSKKNNLDRAKVASNLALAYEMLGDMKSAEQWVASAYDLFAKSSSPNSPDMRRVIIYKAEISRRVKNEETLKMQIP